MNVYIFIEKFIDGIFFDLKIIYFFEKGNLIAGQNFVTVQIKAPVLKFFSFRPLIRGVPSDGDKALLGYIEMRMIDRHPFFKVAPSRVGFETTNNFPNRNQGEMLF